MNQYWYSTTCLSIGAVFQNSGASCSVWCLNMTPPNMFLAPGFSPFSITSTFMPAFAIVYAAADPAGPAPTTTESNFSVMPFQLSSEGLVHRLLREQV